MQGFNLRDLPLRARWLLTLVLASYALNHLTSAALVWEVTRHVDSTAKEHFAFKSLAVLLRMAHQHTFGHGTMYFVTSGIFLFAGLSDRVTLTLITLPFAGATIDLASWFLLKYGSAKWEWLSVAGGLMYSAAFAAMFLVSFHQMWWAGRTDPPKAAGRRGAAG